MEKQVAYDYQGEKKTGQVDVAVTIGAAKKIQGFTLDTQSSTQVEHLVANLRELFAHPDLRNMTFFLSEKDKNTKLDNTLRQVFTANS